MSEDRRLLAAIDYKDLLPSVINDVVVYQPCPKRAIRKAADEIGDGKSCDFNDTFSTFRMELQGRDYTLLLEYRNWVEVETMRHIIHAMAVEFDWPMLDVVKQVQPGEDIPKLKHITLKRINPADPFAFVAYVSNNHYVAVIVADGTIKLIDPSKKEHLALKCLQQIHTAVNEFTGRRHINCKVESLEHHDKSSSNCGPGAVLILTCYFTKIDYNLIDMCKEHIANARRCQVAVPMKHEIEVVCGGKKTMIMLHFICAF
jgi:hypothetical protein